MTNQPRLRIAILGGGITGLAAAYTLAQARRTGAPVDEFLIEGSSRLGGLIRTERVDEFVVEAGPDSFLAEKPEAESLCRELGLADSLMGSNDAARRTYVLHRGRLVRLPDGLQLFAPTRIWPMVTTPLLPATSKLAIAAEWFGLRRARNQQQGLENDSAIGDESVASFVGRHFGNAMLENIADPLLAGVFGGDSACLSVYSVLPRFRQMEQKYGNLVLAFREAKRPRQRATGTAGAPQGIIARSRGAPIFMTLKGGLGEMVERLELRLERARVHCGKRAVAIEPAPAPPGEPGAKDSAASRYRIYCESGGGYEADAIILALPTHECSRLLSPFNPALAANLSAIPYSSAMTVALAYDSRVAASIPSGFGFLAPRKEKRRMLACTFVHGKFQYRTRPGCALLRCFLGGVRDPEVLNLDDDQVLSIVREELRGILGLPAQPLFHRIYRWPSSMPQYVVGHHERVQTIQRQLEHHAGLFLAGNAYSGIGISDCIRTGRSAAEAALCC